MSSKDSACQGGFRGRKREVDPTLSMLREVLMDTPASPEERHAQGRMREMHDMIELLTGWSDDVARLSDAELVQLLQLGARVSKLLELKGRFTVVGGGRRKPRAAPAVGSSMPSSPETSASAGSAASAAWTARTRQTLCGKAVTYQARKRSPRPCGFIAFPFSRCDWRCFCGHASPFSSAIMLFDKWLSMFRGSSRRTITTSLMRSPMRVLIAVLVSLLGAGAVRAQDVQPSPQAGAPPTPVSGVVVTGRKPTHVAGVTVTATDWCPEPDPARHPSDVAPKVVDSYPEPGAVVAPGYILVRVSFDAPMSCYSEVTVDGGGDDDPCEPTGTWELPARRSWIMQCRLKPDTTYALSFKKVDGAGFVGLSGRRAAPYRLAFTTSNASPTPTFEAAHAADPGPPGGPAPAAAYVTCADEAGVVEGQDCRHEIFRRPPD